MRWLTLFLLLALASPLHAATWSWNFENGVVDSMAFGGDPLCLHSNVGADTSGWLSGGIRAYFNNAWHIVRSTPQGVSQCYGESEETKDWYQPTFINAPNGGRQALALNVYQDFNIGSCETAAPASGWAIRFSTPIKTFSFWMASSANTSDWRTFICPLYDPEGGSNWLNLASNDNLFGIQWDGLISGSTGYQQVYLGADAFYEGSACVAGDQSHELCKWQKFTYVFPNGTRNVKFQICSPSGCQGTFNSWNFMLMGVLIDDMEASTALPQCQDPPCEWERAEPARAESSPDPIEPAYVGGPLPRGVRLATLPRHVTPATKVTWGALKGLYYR
jgi:hypothetical protein